MKKIWVIALAGLALSLGGCGNQNGVPVNKPAAEMRTVRDVWGREVEIPRTVTSIICLGSGAPRLAAYLGVAGMMAGAEEHDIRNRTVLRDYNPVWQERLKSLPPVGAGGGSGNNNGYPEEITGLEPDVILAAFSPEAADELYFQTGIPVVCVRYISNELADDTFYAAMRVFAEAVGAEKRCEMLLSFIDACKDDLNTRTAGIPAHDKPLVYAGAVTFNGRHGFAGTSANFGPFLVTNTRNVADGTGAAGYYEVDLEKVIKWDPDVIFLDPGNLDLVNNEYKTNPQYFDSLRAVREGRIYTMPSFNNCGMNITYALTDAYYTGKVLYPEQFADISIEEKAEEILTLFLGENTFEKMAAGGLYYGKVMIGGE